MPLGEAFLTGLRERVVLGVRGSDRRIHVPPAEYGPVTAEELRGLVEVAPTGTVTTWAWNHAPRGGQPLAASFAWVLVRLDGADTALLHALDAPGPDAVRTGMRIRIRWCRRTHRRPHRHRLLRAVRGGPTTVHSPLRLPRGRAAGPHALLTGSVPHGDHQVRPLRRRLPVFAMWLVGSEPPDP